MIIYDHREEACGLPGILSLWGLDLQSTALPVGDYIISDKIIIERKSAVDFVSSLKDGRLFDQAERIKEDFPVSILFLEGKPKMSEKVLQGTIASLIRHGLSVIRVEDIQDSASWITTLYRQESKRKGKTKIRGQRKEPLDPEKSSLLSLAMIPGVSMMRAKNLMNYFSTLQNIANADIVELQKVEGIGKKTALSIYSCFNYDYNDIPIKR